jgi:DNA-binding NarL/FixJ family response regulator
MKIQLSEIAKNRLERQHKKEKNSKVADRIKSILLPSEGWSNKQIAQALRIHENTVSNHIDGYESKNKLKNESGAVQVVIFQMKMPQSLLSI